MTSNVKTVTVEDVVRDMFPNWFTEEKIAEENPLVYDIVIRRLTERTQEALDTLVDRGTAIKVGADRYTVVVTGESAVRTWYAREDLHGGNPVIFAPALQINAAIEMGGLDQGVRRMRPEAGPSLRRLPVYRMSRRPLAR